MRIGANTLSFAQFWQTKQKKNNWKIIRQRSKQTKQDETVEGRVLPMEAEFTRRWEPCQWCNCETQFKLKVTVST